MSLNVLEGDSVAQLAHAGWGAALTFTLARWLPLWAAVLIVVSVSFGKEAAEATGIAFWEPRQDWPSSLKDFAFFGVGIAWAMGVLLLPR